ncbi:MAG TPA: ATP-dependent metallopeptidase FtsH/Yme1/Tma family protein, partial [Amnibacterium sp.]|nr:ATP-dependent metallopeptidase FtsH/Yme1/Tma family protein [Amnibacterium sp.]
MTARARSGPPGDRPPAPAPRKPPGWRQWLIPLGLLLTLLFLFLPVFGSPAAKAVSYGTLLAQLRAGDVDTLVLRSDGGIVGQYRSAFESGATFTSTYPTGLGGPDPAFVSLAHDPRLVPHFDAQTVGNSFLGT